MNIQPMIDTTTVALRYTHAFILAGGRGERLHPLTASRPKPAVAFGGTSRIIDFTLLNCLHSRLSRVSVLTQYKHEELDRYIREEWADLWGAIDRSREPLVCLPPVRGKRYRGTADAIFQSAVLIPKSAEFVLVLSGDHIYEMDYRDLLRQHVETKAELTIAAVEYPIREASSFGVVCVDKTSRVVGFEEKPAFPKSLASNPSSALVSMGVYVFAKSILLGALDTVCGSGQGFDFGRDVIPALIRSVRTHAYYFRDPIQSVSRYWRDIGTIDAYYAASMDVVESRVAQPQTNSWIDARAEVRRSIISPGVVVGRNATVHESVLLPGVCVGNGAQLRRVIVEEGVHVPAGFCAGLDTEHDRNQQAVSAGGVVVIADARGGAAASSRSAPSGLARPCNSTA